MAHRIVIAFILLASCAYGRGWTSWDYTNGEPGLVQYQQLMSCAVERCSAVGVTFAYVTSNRVSSGYTVSGYGYSTSVVAGVTNVVRWTNYVENSAWVVTTNQLTDWPSAGLLYYLDGKMTEILASQSPNPYYANHFESVGGSFDSWFSARASTPAYDSVGLWRSYTGGIPVIPPRMYGSNMLAWIGTTNGYYPSVWDQIQPEHEGQSNIVAASLMAGRVATQFVVVGSGSNAVTNIASYTIGFTRSHTIYVLPMDKLDTNDPFSVECVLLVSRACDDCEGDSEAEIGVYGARVGKPAGWEFVTIDAAGEYAMTSVFYSVSAITSTWQVTESPSATGSLNRTLVEVAYKNVGAMRSRPKSSYQLSVSALWQRQRAWDSLRWVVRPQQQSTWYSGRANSRSTNYSATFETPVFSTTVVVQAIYPSWDFKYEYASQEETIDFTGDVFYEAETEEDAGKNQLLSPTRWTYSNVVAIASAFTNDATPAAAVDVYAGWSAFIANRVQAEYIFKDGYIDDPLPCSSGATNPSFEVGYDTALFFDDIPSLSIAKAQTYERAAGTSNVMHVFTLGDMARIRDEAPLRDSLSDSCSAPGVEYDLNWIWKGWQETHYAIYSSFFVLRYDDETFGGFHYVMDE